MITDLLLISINSLFIVCFEQLLHSLSHSPKYGGRLYRWHKLHHMNYPPNKLRSTKYINSGEGKLIENLFLYSILLTQFCIYTVTSLRTFIIFFTQSMGYSIIVNHLHIQYHLRDSYLDNYQWFKKRRDYHLLHHKNSKFNLGFITNRIDKLSGTFIGATDFRNLNN